MVDKAFHGPTLLTSPPISVSMCSSHTGLISPSCITRLPPAPPQDLCTWDLKSGEDMHIGLLHARVIKDFANAETNLFSLLSSYLWLPNRLSPDLVAQNNQSVVLTESVNQEFRYGLSLQHVVGNLGWITLNARLTGTTVESPGGFYTHMSDVWAGMT